MFQAVMCMMRNLRYCHEVSAEHMDGVHVIPLINKTINNFTLI